MKTLFFILGLSICVLAQPARADLAANFTAMTKQEKGPFGLNILQGTASRTTVASGQSPKNFLFQAAYRNEFAQRLAAEDGVYVANLFTTNYYELMGEYVYGDAQGNHPLDHAALLARNAEAMPKATRMVQNWVLEKHYVEHFQNSKLARSFKLRGISGSEFEQAYAKHFFNFYLSSLSGDFQYLPAFLLVNLSPIVDSASLQRAREMIMSSYDYFVARLGANDPMVKSLYKLRNAIHNQLSKDVIRQIDIFLREFPQYEAEGNTYIQEIRKILVNYYSFNADKLSVQAQKLGYSELQAAADKITKRGVSADYLNDLSRAAADLRTHIGDSRWVKFENRGLTLALLSNVTQFLNRELSDLNKVNDPVVIEALVNTVYAEGFLIKDNFDFFVTEIATGADLAPLLADLLEITSAGEGSTLYEAFAPAYQQWVSIEPKMQYFMDNTIKSSSLSTVATIAQRLK